MLNINILMFICGICMIPIPFFLYRATRKYEKKLREEAHDKYFRKGIHVEYLKKIYNDRH